MTDDTTEERSVLTPERAARAEALDVARASLTDTSRTPLSGAETLPKRFGTQDLIDVAQWVLDGTDPLAEYRRMSDGDDASVGTTSDSDEGDDRPGDVRRITFDDGSTRLFVNTGIGYYSPAVENRFEEPMTVEYGSRDIFAIEFVAREREV